MLKLKLACALLARIISLYSATAVVAVKLNLAVAVLCITIVVALLNTLWDTNAHGQPRAGKFPD
jgi:hypothetical protein